MASVDYTLLNAWTANLINNISGSGGSLRQALEYWSKKYLTSIKTVSTVASKGVEKEKMGSKSKSKSITTITPFTFDQTYAVKLLDTAANELGTARVELFNLINVPGISPEVANRVMTSFDQAIQPLFDFQKNTNGTLPNLDLYVWYLKYFRSVLISLDTKSKK